jgi:hypothetical protein
MSMENRENGDHAVTTIDGKEVYLEDLCNGAEADAPWLLWLSPPSSPGPALGATSQQRTPED